MSSDNKRQERIKVYARYSGMAFQIFGLLLVAMLIGKQIDLWMGNEKYYFAAGLSVVVLIAWFYKLIIELGKKE
ncbi:MAG: hypothetical protein HKO89_05070 [Saprospiraceae bacterium]|nr:hypothetical protein [Bacteroidia bacterium]NNK89960.1 hypothetical protein [Saprospiraceae bacterium]